LLLSVTIRFLGKALPARLEGLLPLSDNDLVEAYQRQEDPHVISILMERYASAIVGMSMKYLKDEEAVRDFSGDLFLKLRKKMRNAEIRNFKSWLLTMVSNQLNDLNRKTKVRQDYKIRVSSNGQEIVEEELDFEMDKAHLANALLSLSEEERLVIQRIYYHGESYQEIMETQQWTFNQVRGKRDRAITKLRGLLANDFTHYFNQT
jgi:RNA polymerase sigma factor (sigma-70 family)